MDNDLMAAFSLRQLFHEGVMMQVYKEWLLPHQNNVINLVITLNFSVGIAIHGPPDADALDPDAETHAGASVNTIGDMIVQAYIYAIQVEIHGKATTLRLQNLVAELSVPGALRSCLMLGY